MKSPTIVSLLLLSVLSFASAQDARSKCRSLHHMDADVGSSYVNSNCQLICLIHGKTTVHNMNEGLTCPLASTGICRNGFCQQSRVQVGHIDVNVVSARLSRKATNVYASVCLQNGTEAVTLPLRDRSRCVTCSSNMAHNTKHPKWNAVCANSGSRLFSVDSRVVLEVWDKLPRATIFLGGATLTIPQLLQNGDNHKEVKLGLVGGAVSGRIKSRITWTVRQ